MTATDHDPSDHMETRRVVSRSGHTTSRCDNPLRVYTHTATTLLYPLSVNVNAVLRGFIMEGGLMMCSI